ncbi:efflux RND transporter periplasmic adaptor subunit [Thioalkalivibrio sp. ALE20]|uniref:efflux RND transporter periplasmic adaptor subunit n=1 Tax=Thioalkalivibrio sp. ALE20 TaxID=545275 RepID=UPI00037FC808|nr:efflux RND transporter periplasmic adaptor subunit [Thioalkalivibrio sp. ALE20]
MKASGIIGGILVLALAAGGAWWLQQQDDAGAARATLPDSGERDERTPVRVSEVAPREFETVIEALGTVAARESVTVRAPVTARVESLEFEDGDRVEAGDVLVELRAEEERARRDEARVRVEEASRELARVRDRVEDGIVTRQEVDQQASRLAEARAALAAATAQVEDRTIRAPFTGTLGLREVSPGAMVTPDTALVELDDIRTVRLDFPVPERFAGAIELGMPVTGHSAVGDFAADVTALSNRIDAATRTLNVRAVADNPEQRLRPGMLATVRLALDPQRAPAVPEGAVVQTADQHFVFRLQEDETVSRDRIRIGRRAPGWVEVLDGVETGDTVVSEGVSRVRDGMTVRVLESGDDG